MNKEILKIDGLKSKVEGKDILKGIDLEVSGGEIHVIMGPNGAGKSTLASVLMGHPKHEVTNGSVQFLNKDLLAMKVDERSRNGLFMSFQYPEEVPGVSVENFLRTAKKQTSPIMPPMMTFKKEILSNMEMLNMDGKYLERSLNQGFSGGEKKKNEILQMAILAPKLSILDETDSGLDVDAIKVVYESVQRLSNDSNAVIIITHYSKILKYITPTKVHVLMDGRIVKSGGLEIADQIEKEGYESFR